MTCVASALILQLSGPANTRIRALSQRVAVAKRYDHLMRVRVGLHLRPRALDRIKQSEASTALVDPIADRFVESASLLLTSASLSTLCARLIIDRNAVRASTKACAEERARAVRLFESYSADLERQRIL